MFDWVRRHHHKIREIGMGLFVYETFNFLYDFVFYSFAIAYWGLIDGGAICWFKFGHSDSRKISNSNACYIRVQGLGLLPFFACPHYIREKDRHLALKRILKARGGAAIAIDDCAALEINGKTYRTLSSKKDATAYKCFWEKQVYREILLKRGKLNNLLQGRMKEQFIAAGIGGKL